MPTLSTWDYDREADKLRMLLPHGPRVIVIGSTSFWHAQSERTCIEIGRLLAAIPNLSLITGGVEGVGETTSRSFFQSRLETEQEPRVYHVLPQGEESWDFGQTYFAGRDMTQRREILARLGKVYLAVEGGPGTVHEAEVAARRGALIIPVGRSGGHSAVLYSQLERPAAVDEKVWGVLGSGSSEPAGTAEAAVRAVQACLSEP